MSILKTFQAQLQRPIASGSKYLAEIDGLRFVAIFLVAIQHLSERIVRNSPVEFSIPIKNDAFAFLISRGTVGVFLFFAISGFVLAMPFGKNKPLSIAGLKTFYGRRLTRIEPPFVLWMSIFTLVLVIKNSYSLAEIAPHWLASITYTHWFFFGKYSVINPVAWSLEIEIQFYLLAPFLATAYFSIKNKKTRRVGLVLFMIAFILLEWAMGWLHFPMKATLLGRLPNFLIGFLVADLYINDWKTAPSVSKGFQSLKWDFIALIALLTMCYTWTEELGKTFVFHFSLALLMISGFKSHFFRIFLSKRNIAAMGGMCYTIYLIHLPLLEVWSRLSAKLVFTNNYAVTLLWQSAVVLPIIFFISALFFIVSEKPFMKHDWYLSVNLKSSFSMTYKKVLKFTTFILALFLVSNTFAQTDVELDSTTAKTIRLRPLSILTDLALQNSPSIQANAIDVARQTLTYKVQKNSWTDLVNIQAMTMYGNGSLLDAADNGTATRYVLSDRKSLNTNISLGFRVSAGDLVTRGTKAEIQKVQVERLKAERGMLEQHLKEVILVLYTQLESSLKKIKIKAEAVENQKITLAIAEKYFKEGNFQPGEYSTILAKVSNAEEQYEDIKAETKKLQLMLKNLVNAPIFER